MEELVPDWLCNDFLTKCLQNQKDKRNAIVTNFIASPAAPAGNNYGSIVLRLKVEYKISEDDSQQHSLSLIIKAKLTKGALKEAFGEMIKYDVEPVFYSKFLSVASQFTSISFAPKVFTSPISSAVVLEDLKETGFLMADKTKQLDFEHCRLYCIAAATLHAASVAVHKENPELVESIGKEKLFTTIESDGEKSFKIMINNGLKCFADHIEQTEKFKKYSKLIRQISAHHWDMLVDAHKPSKVLNTINQGDPWLTNMMFKYDQYGNVVEMKLLDFQALRYGSPVNDIAFFIWSSANHDVQSKRLDDLYHIYLETLNEKLEMFKCTERLTFDAFRQNMQKLHPLAIMAAGIMVPSICYPTVVDMEQLFGKVSEDKDEINPFKQFYDETYCKNRLPQLLEDLESNGVFDYLEKYIQQYI